MSNGILHRDLSPGNAYLYDTEAHGQDSAPEGGEGFIADFDVAIIQPTDRIESTETVITERTTTTRRDPSQPIIGTPVNATQRSLLAAPFEFKHTQFSYLEPKQQPGAGISVRKRFSPSCTRHASLTEL